MTQGTWWEKLGRWGSGSQVGAGPGAGGASGQGVNLPSLCPAVLGLCALIASKERMPSASALSPKE